MTTPYLLHHLLERAAASHPDKQAVVDRERRFDFLELAAAMRTCAGRLREIGVRRRDRVAIWLDKSFEEVASIFGVASSDAVFVPVSSQLKPAQVRHILADCEVRALITTQTRADALAGSDDSLPQILIAPELYAKNTSCVAESSCVGEDLAAILYTSGSTGRPKGVMLSHRNLLAGSRIVSSYLGIERDERVLSILPFSFDYGLNQLITVVENAATIVLSSFRFGDEIVRTIAAERCTALAGVPALWAVLSKATPSLRTTPLPTLRYITNSGGAVPTDTLQRLRELLPDTRIFLMYGLTEAFRSTYLPPEELDRRPTSIGRAIPESEVFLVNPETLKRCEPGEQGILVHRGPTVSLGYWNRPQETAQTLRKNPTIGEHEGADVVCWSGDLVRSDEDGFFYFVGRTDAMIKSAGYRISPTEVEEVLMASGRLQQAAVIGLPDPMLGERVHALVVAAPGTGIERDELLQQCARELPSHMIPREIELVPELPCFPNGKVDYHALKAQRASQASP
jgi:acyl-CoA ligase (AMP-forming) (exosortase A-associated)